MTAEQTMTTHSSLKITISKEYIDDFNLRSWLNIELPASFPETDNPIPAFEEALAKVRQMYSIAEGKATNPQKENIGNDEDIYALMDKCKTVEELKSYFLVANVNGKSLLHYNNKLKQLSNG